MHGTQKKLLLLIGDVVLLYAALFIVLSFFYGSHIGYEKVMDHVYAFSYLFVVWLAVFYIWNLYNLELYDYINNYIKALTINIVIAVFYFYAIPFSRISPKTNLLLVAVVFTVFFVLWRLSAVYVFSLIRPYYQLVLVGIDEHMEDLAHRVMSKKGSNYSLHTIVNLENEEIPEFFLEKNVQVEKDLDCLRRLAERCMPVKVVVRDDLYPKIFKQLYSYLHDRIRFYFVASFWEEAEREVPIYATSEIWFLENLKNVQNRLYEGVKRAVDILLSLLTMPIVLFIYLLIGIAIKINSPGPIIFRQKRVGVNGEVFDLYKFRSMYRDAEKDGEARWAEEGDRRITAVGNFLRRTRVDELPQVFNVLRGEMSFIGPRPERPEFVDILSERIPHYGLRHLVRPGLTGWAQVNYEYASTEEETAIKLSYDLYYVKNRSALLDMKILLKTVLVIFEQKGR